MGVDPGMPGKPGAKTSKPKTKKPEAQDIPVYQIDDPPLAMHPDITPEEIQGLADSIKKVGQLQEITVRPVGDHYQVVIGHVRVLAAKAFNIPTLRARIVDVDEATALGMTAEENFARSDHNPLTELQILEYLTKSLKMTPQQINEKYGWSEQWIRGRLSLLKLPSQLIQYIGNRTLKIGAALILHKLSTPEEQIKFGVDFASGRYSVPYATRMVATYIHQRETLQRPLTPEEMQNIQQEPLMVCEFGAHQVKMSHMTNVMLCKDCLETINYLKVKDKREQPPRLPPIGPLPDQNPEGGIPSPEPSNP